MSEICRLDWTAGIKPTSYRVGSKYHPAIRNNGKTWYWPNITFPTSAEASSRAYAALSDAIEPAYNNVAQWNVVRP